MPKTCTEITSALGASSPKARGRAHSIIDWERRMFLLVAERNNLTIVHIKEGETLQLWGYDCDDDTMPRIYTLNGKPTKPEWYRHYPEAEAEAIRRFKEEQEQAASPFPPSLSLSSFLSGLEEEQRQAGTANPLLGSATHEQSTGRPVEAPVDKPRGCCTVS